MPVAVERSSYKPRVADSLIALPRTRLSVSEKVRNTANVLANIDAVLPNQSEKPRDDAGLDRWISYFDTNWQKEGLSSDWQNMRTKGERKTIGFSMKGQMEMLENASDKKAVSEWAQKTRQDLLGFKLEYLSDHLVYPCKYEWSGDRLENKAYGNKDMVETTSAQERNGSVRNALKDMKEFFRTAPDGAIAVMTSPKGDSGLRTDDGEKIFYPDSYFFIMQKNGDKVINYTLKTDFTVHECRDAIGRMTGKKPPVTASLEEYAKAIATIKPGKGNEKGVLDVVKLLRGNREHAFENDEVGKIGWDEVYKDIREGEKLYNFNKKTQEAIDAFEAYCLLGNHTRAELQKAIAATILRMSKLFYEDEAAKQKLMQVDKPYTVSFISTKSSFGDILGAVAERPGCAGGGGGSGRSMVVEGVGGGRSGSGDSEGLGMLTGMYGYDEKDGLVYRCQGGHINDRPKGGFRKYCHECGIDMKC